MTDIRHLPYGATEPPDSDDIAALKRYLQDEFRRIEQSQNGVDLDVETRWQSAGVPGAAGYIRLPTSYKLGSAIKPSITVLFPISATEGTTLIYTLARRMLNPNETAGGYSSLVVTATAHPGIYCKRVEFADVTAVSATIDTIFDVSAVGVNQTYAHAVAPTVLSIDLRYEMDSHGSEQPYFKNL